MRAVPLHQADEVARYGGKAAGLARCVAAGLPVPEGVALSWRLVEAWLEGAPEALHALAAVEELLRHGPVAVRSSAVGEDGERASYAGQHATVLGVRSMEAVHAAVRTVHLSRRSSEAYRARRELDGELRMAVVVQRLVPARCAGVLFTRCPVSKRDERVAEVNWGLGETVVSGEALPDRLRWHRGGHNLRCDVGDKDVRAVVGPEGLTHETVPPELRAAPCLGLREVQALEQLAATCESLFGPSDLEFAVEAGHSWLLQCRPVTT
ncbi:MAG: PEP/pyruvate-binding domain-containing protein [Myxococcota bacterium]